MRSIFLWRHNNDAPALSQLFPRVMEQYMHCMILMTSPAHTEFKQVGRSAPIHKRRSFSLLKLCAGTDYISHFQAHWDFFHDTGGNE